MTPFAAIAWLLILARGAAQFGLEWLNRRHVKARASAVPEAFREFIDPDTYAQSVQYTLARSRFSQIEGGYDLGILLVILFSGVLPWGGQWFQDWLGGATASMAAFLMVSGVIMFLLGLPLDF